MLTNEWLNGTENAGAVFSLRKEFFAEVPDAYDRFAMQLAVYEGDELAASGRIYTADNGRFFISHVCVKESFRKRGLGDLTVKLLMYRGFAFAEKLYAAVPKELSSWFSLYGFKKEDDDEGRRVIMSVKKDECVYPSKCAKKDMI